MKVTEVCIYQNGSQACNAWMFKDINEIRRKNALTILEDRFHGTVKTMADALDVAPGFVSRVLNGSGASSRNIGDSLARRIEQVSGKAANWLDHDHSIDWSNLPEQPNQLDDIERLMKLSTPRSRNSLQRIAEAAAENRLTEADCELLATIASRIAR